MSEWSQKLRRSGYPATIRHQVIKTAVEKYDNMCEDEDKGIRPVHRSRAWREKERKREKEIEVKDWHKNQLSQVSAP